MDTIFSPHDTLQPDLLFISKEREHIIKKVVEGAPDLVIEIKSPGNTPTSMSYKKHVYESIGVKEYWYVLPEKQSVIQYENIEDELVRKNVLIIGDVLKSFMIAGFEMPLTDIFE